MAVVTGPLHSSEARGSVGSLQYNSWRGRATVRTRSGPAIADQYTDARNTIRGYAAAATLIWQSMSDTARSAWNEYARSHIDPDWTGSGKRLTGYNWFIRINVRKQIGGYSIQSFPPTTTVTIVLTQLQIHFDGPLCFITWEAQGIWEEWNTDIEIWVTKAHSAGANPTVKQAHRITAVLLESYQCYVDTTPGEWFTVFIRPRNVEGVVGGWISLKFQAPMV